MGRKYFTLQNKVLFVYKLLATPFCKDERQFGFLKLFLVLVLVMYFSKKTS